MFDERVYLLDFFKSRGFKRKRCANCGSYFWTLDDGREVCGEAPCEPYSFLGKPPTYRRFSLKEMRDEFLRFFNENGHEIIDPYPVVPRWRRDLFLVSASIVDFQPHVTSGVAEPPANPLVISQPCIRLVDIDKVGLTFGRHMTIFEMGGAHAFNYSDRTVYWKDETVMYCHEFLKKLGVAEELVTYKESIWSGGGNAGPCFEVVACGLEVATLVFMNYKTTHDGVLEEIPIKTVDTGYGIERFTWLSQGVPSAFDAVYGGIVEEAERLIGRPKLDEELITNYAKFSAWIKPEEGGSVKEARRRAASLASVEIEPIEEELRKLENFYAVLDFTKALTFILADGVVPSNAKVGYLARLLLRRTYRLLQRLNVHDKLLDLIELQVKWWGGDFPKLLDMREEIIDIVNTEVERFVETIEKGRQMVEKELRNVKQRGQSVSTEFFVKMYDEKGITPDIVAEVADKLSMQVNPPENIYELVAALHASEKVDSEAVDERFIRAEQLVKGLQPTRKVYYERTFERTHNATVIRSENGMVVLDSTIFYPEGGGQVSDTGKIFHPKGECEVFDVQLVNDVVVHFIKGTPPSEGDLVTCVVDYERRLSIMRHHTATHIMIGAVRRVLGKHAWQMGAKKEPDKARLDISHHKRLTRKEIEAIEMAVNEVIRRRTPVEISWQKRKDAERTFGFSIYQGGEVPLGVIRIVHIPGWDAEACGGLHCETTEDVGIIKVVKTERIQDGVERLIFTAGPALLSYVQESNYTLEDVAEKLSTPVEKVREKLDDVLEELKDVRKTMRRLATSLAEIKGEVLYSRAEDVRGIKFSFNVEEIAENEYLLALANSIIANREGATVALIVGKGERPSVIVMCNEKANELGVDAGRIASVFCSAIGGRGGGKKDLGQGGGGRVELVKKGIEAVKEEIRKVLG